MVDLRKAAEMALEALEDSMYPQKKQFDAIVGLKQALAQEEQEPVAWRWLYNGKPDSDKCFDGKGPDADVILRAASSVMPRTVQYFYTAPPSKPWVSLTEEESSDIYNAHHNTYSECITSAHDLVLDVEAKLKERNT